MKIIKYFIIFFTANAILVAVETSPHLEKVLSSIKDAKSSELSRSVSTYKIETRNNFDLLVKQALLTKNTDLIKLLEDRVKAVDWGKDIPQRKGDLAGREKDLKALALLKSPLIKKYKSFFLKSVDFDDVKYTAWQGAHWFRGNQGCLARALAEYSPVDFKELIELLDDPSISSSQKRTVAWAMRYDHSGMSEKILTERLKNENPLSLKRVFKDSLIQLRADIKYKKNMTLQNLTKANELLDMSAEDLKKKIGDPDNIKDNIYFYKLSDGQTGIEISWAITLRDGKVISYKKNNP